MENKISSKHFSFSVTLESNIADVSNIWCGLDEYEKILYIVDIRHELANGPSFHLMKLNLFLQTISTVKIILPENYLQYSDSNISGDRTSEFPILRWWCSRAHTAISKNGRLISFLLRLHSSSRKFLFCLLEIETDNFSVYRFSHSEKLKI